MTEKWVPREFGRKDFVHEDVVIGCVVRGINTWLADMVGQFTLFACFDTEADATEWVETNFVQNYGG